MPSHLDCVHRTCKTRHIALYSEVDLSVVISQYGAPFVQVLLHAHQTGWKRVNQLDIKLGIQLSYFDYCMANGEASACATVHAFHY